MCAPTAIQHAAGYRCRGYSQYRRRGATPAGTPRAAGVPVRVCEALPAVGSQVNSIGVPVHHYQWMHCVGAVRLRVVLRVTAKLHYRIVASLRCCARRRSSDSCLGRFRACRGAQRSHSCAAFTQTTAVRARACVRECVCACVCVSGVSGSRRRRRPSTTLC